MFLFFLFKKTAPTEAIIAPNKDSIDPPRTCPVVGNVPSFLRSFSPLTEFSSLLLFSSLTLFSSLSLLAFNSSFESVLASGFCTISSSICSLYFLLLFRSSFSEFFKELLSIVKLITFSDGFPALSKASTFKIYLPSSSILDFPSYSFPFKVYFKVASLSSISIIGVTDSL